MGVYQNFSDYNADNVVRTIEEVRTIDRNVNVKEEKSMEKKLAKALFVWVDVDDNGKMNHRFERTMNGRWFDWSTHISYSNNGFIKMLDKKREGKGFDIYYAR